MEINAHTLSIGLYLPPKTQQLIKKTMRTKYLFLLLIGLMLAACSPSGQQKEKELRYRFGNLFDIAYTPDTLHRCGGWFTDAGSWMGFTVPERSQWVNGFCGPFSLDMFRRQWIARTAVQVAFADAPQLAFQPDTTCYYPGELYLKSHNDRGTIEQHLWFADAHTALLRIDSDLQESLLVSGDGWGRQVTLSLQQNSVVASHPSGECVAISFPPEAIVQLVGENYQAQLTAAGGTPLYVAISFYATAHELEAGLTALTHLLSDPSQALQANADRWQGYLSKVLRDDLDPAYDRIAAKAVTTLISNWRTHRAGLLHDGIIPSHAVGYFVGYWAWDSWRFCAATARFAPELAKNNMRAMFDYQQPDGMVIDCVYTDPSENNARDSKPPLACWAVDEIFTHTGDTAFVAEMYPSLLAYYKWWFQKRDHNGNGFCEYGSTDGTLEAAAWESGMDNAIRFDETQMLKNEGAADAWSMNQESIDLNAYLALECRLLQKFAHLVGKEFDGPLMEPQAVSTHFFDEETGFFYDRRLADDSFVREPGCEAYTALWTQVATPAQVERMMPLLQDTTKFSTFIPFPTVAADNPRYNPRGYWRGPIWLDQTYFAIRGLRNYGYQQLADQYTRQVFDRLAGLKEGAPIHENYDTHTGVRLKAPHFSWSAVHLLLMYEELK